MRLGTPVTFLGLALTLACSPASDIGNPCPLNVDAGISLGAGNAFVYNGDAFCQNLVCLRPGNYTKGDAGWGFCSNSPCTPDDGTLGHASQDCNSSSTGLVCDSLTAGTSFTTIVDAEDGGAALLAEYLGTTYCTTPGN
jgi:hypothetical protein